MKKFLCAAAAVICLISILAGCGSSGESVPVMSVAVITGYASQVDSFAGKVVSGQTEKVENDNDRKIAETYVEVGDMVQAGDVLFAYDLEDMQLSLEKLQLEYEQMQQNITDKQSTVTTLQGQLSSLSAADRASYTLQISSLQTDIRELEYNSTLKEQEIETMQDNMENAEVTATISGRVMSIKDLSTASADSTDPYITIMDVSAYRIEGQINELNIGTIYEGMPVLVRSRTDESIVWNGVIESIDLENPQTTGSADSMYSAGDDYTTSSKYMFYVHMDNTDDLILGQHVYIEPDYGQENSMYLDAGYIVIDDDGTAYVWAAGKNTLEKRTVELGEYNEDSMSWEVLSGLDYSDYIAFPADDLKEGCRFEIYEDNTAGDDTAFYTDDTGFEESYIGDEYAEDEYSEEEYSEEYSEEYYEDEYGGYDKYDEYDEYDPAQDTGSESAAEDSQWGTDTYAAYESAQESETDIYASGTDLPVEDYASGTDMTEG